MERNTSTIAKKLITGDRFYKANDRKKTVLQMVEHETKKTYFRTYRYWYMSDTDRFPQPINPDTAVIFLRHTNEPGTTTGLAEPVHAGAATTN